MFAKVLVVTLRLVVGASNSKLRNFECAKLSLAKWGAKLRANDRILGGSALMRSDALVLA
jgi:hypothetical protein